MEKVRKGVKRILVMRASLARKAWVNIILFLLAGVMIGFGVYLSSQPEGTKRADIRWYNQGVSVYNEAILIPATEESPAEFPIENIRKAAAYFQQVASESTDNGLKTLALYNLGTLIGRDYLVFMEERTPGLGVVEGISKLAEAVRIDPNNEDAKYNLELLEKMRNLYQESAILLGYSAGAIRIGDYIGIVDKGY
jgi:hypothetical protein